MTIGGKEVKEIWVLTRDNELIASVSQMKTLSPKTDMILIACHLRRRNPRKQKNNLI